jgi:hypothetical protein
MVKLQQSQIQNKHIKRVEIEEVREEKREGVVGRKEATLACNLFKTFLYMIP